MKKSFIITILSCVLFLFSNCSNCQTRLSAGVDSNIDTLSVTNTNQFDKNGLRQGLWIGDKGLRTYTYYKDNLKNGTFVSYHKNGNLYGVGKFENGKLVGTWFSFDSNGFLVFERSQIEIIETQKGIKYTSYLKEFYKSGVLKSEGRIISADDFEIDFIKNGIWKYFNNDGIINKTEEYINGKISDPQ